VLTEEQNRRLTEVGPGTPAGELLRRYWQPVAAAAVLDRERVLGVRILGEDLALFKTEKGELGLVQQRCPHRSASIACGIPSVDGIRCPYHGWYFSPEGECIGQPFEDLTGSGKFKEQIKITAYPVRELNGLVFAYLGPSPSPELPMWDAFVDPAYERSIQITYLPCNYLQCMENSLDPVHFEWLHANQFNFQSWKRGQPPRYTIEPHVKIAFDVFEFGIVKRRLLAGDTEDCDGWKIGHPILFPNVLAHRASFQYRVPIDDENTLHITYSYRPQKDGDPPQETIPVSYRDYKDPDGSYILDQIYGQDMMAWVTPGAVSPRHLEHTGNSDQGILLYRRMLSENIERVLAGQDPLGVIRDPKRNNPMIALPREVEERSGLMPIGGRRDR
jgi:5,5'-dehydrodivanillate O-demethylase oxygenase subunit